MAAFVDMETIVAYVTATRFDAGPATFWSSCRASWQGRPHSVGRGQDRHLTGAVLMAVGLTAMPFPVRDGRARRGGRQRPGFQGPAASLLAAAGPLQ